MKKIFFTKQFEYEGKIYESGKTYEITTDRNIAQRFINRGCIDVTDREEIIEEVKIDKEEIIEEVKIEEVKEVLEKIEKDVVENNVLDKEEVKKPKKTKKAKK